jgi:DNA (cytosine-5)-methyltransferase 1
MASSERVNVDESRNISEIMRRVKSVNTTPEIEFRKRLRTSGLTGYRISPKNLPGKPDLILPSSRIAIFIDGDFWHGNQWRKRNFSDIESQFHGAKSRDYWIRKIKGNMVRDMRVTFRLQSDGWTVLRFWESDILSHPDPCIILTLESSKGGYEPNPYSSLASGTFADFFAGIGLMRLGLERGGWRGVFANDIDPKKLEMYETNFGNPDGHYLLQDIHKLEAWRTPSVTLATASFPCNDLSIAGSWAGLNGPKSSAFWGFTKLLDEMGERKPPIILLENVLGFLLSRGGRDLQEALLALNDLGYMVDTFTLDALHFVPQSRPRLFVVGVLADSLMKSEHPRTPLSLNPNATRPERLVDFVSNHPDVDWRLRSLPPPPRHNQRLEGTLEELPSDSPEWWTRGRVDYLLNQMSTRHRAVADKMIQGLRFSYGTVFRRIRKGRSMAELRTDGIAGCLRTPLGGSGRQILLKAGKGRCYARLLTSRECARLMGADDYHISPSIPLNQALYGFGDAVCVPVVEWIAKYYLNPLVSELIRGRPLHPTRKGGDGNGSA